MALEHMVWLTPKAGVGNDKMEEILVSIRALTHIPGVLAISAGQNITDRANGATHGVLVTLEQAADLSAYLNHPDHQAVGVVLREHCEVLALDYERERALTEPDALGANTSRALPASWLYSPYPELITIWPAPSAGPEPLIPPPCAMTPLVPVTGVVVL